MKTRNLLLLLGLAAAFGGLLYLLSGSFSSYSDFASARSTGREVHVVARWIDREAAQYDAARDEFTFVLQDSLNHRVVCVYPDPKPANLENADRLVVVGRYAGERFVADRILLKCPSKYKNETLEVTPTRQPA